MRKLFALSILLLFPTLLRAQCALDNTSLQTCINAAAANSTITVSPGNVTWTSGITVNKPLTIICGGSCTVTYTVSTGVPITLVPVTIGIGNPTRISGFNFVGSAAAGSRTLAPFLNAGGNCSRTDCTYLRIDHNTFTNITGGTMKAFGMMVIGDFFGVIDHNTITGEAATFTHFAEVSHASFPCPATTCNGNGFINGFFGDSSWAQSEFFGSGKFLFFEDNTFNNASATEMEQVPPPQNGAPSYGSEGGGRAVVRFNTFNQNNQLANPISAHGTESDGRPRGFRAWEFYKNTQNFPNFFGANCAATSGNCGQFMGSMRSGNGLVWGNTIRSNTTNYGFAGLSTMRALGATGGWKACDGSNPMDGVDGGASPNVYFTGTIQSFVVNSGGGSVTITFANGAGTGTVPPWTGTQWTSTIGAGQAYSLHDSTLFAASGGIGSQISGNTSNTLTILRGGPAIWTPSVGDSVSIMRAFWCADAAGRGAGKYFDYLLFPYTSNNSFPTTTAEISSPSYFWMNTFTNTTPGGQTGNIAVANSAQTSQNTLRNRDFYNEAINQAAQSSPTLPFDGTPATTGIGHGTLANRPTSCTPNTAPAPNTGSPGTAYAEIDGSGNFIQLDYCIATNTWSTTGSSPASYVPFVHPHPLVSGQAQALSPSCSPINGVVPIVGGVTCINSNSPPTVICWRVNATPATNGLGTGCAAGTQYTGAIAVSSPETLNVVAGAASQLDSTVQSYIYTASASVPTVTTTTATGITTSNAVAGGTVTSNGGAPVTSEGTCFGTTANPTSPCTSDGGSNNPSTFISSLTGLTSGTVYFYRAFATNSVGTGFGNDLSFTTTSSNCANPVPIGTSAYTACHSTFINLPQTTQVTVSTTPAQGNGIEIIISACGPSCNSAIGVAPTMTISDNLTDPLPEPCFTATQGTPYAMAIPAVPDFETFWAYYCPSIPAGVTTFVATAGGTLGAFDLDEVEWKQGQIASTGFFDPVDNLTTNPTPSTSVTVATTGPTSAANELITALVVNCGLVSANVGPGYTGLIINPSGTAGHILEAKGVTSIQSPNATASMSWSSGTPLGNCGLGQPAPNDVGFGVILPLSNTPISGAGTIAFSPTSLGFGNLPLYIATSPMQGTVTNTGSVSVTISSVTTTGVFAMVTPPVQPDCRTIGTLAPSASCNFTVTVTPASAGVTNGSIIFVDTAAGSPQVFPLSVTGLQVAPSPAVSFGGN